MTSGKLAEKRGSGDRARGVKQAKGEEARLAIKKEEHEAFLEQVGRDGSQLLSMLYQEETPALLASLPQGQIL